MDRIHVKKDNEIIYDICFSKDFSFITKEIKALSYPVTTRICVVTDSNVQKLWLDELSNELSNTFPNTKSFVFDAGEKNKTLDTVRELYTFLIENKFDRKSLIIAFGGGVTGDLAGFAAATYLRGIDFIQVPSTLLSMVDSSVGGKTGVDFDSFKNMVGAFYMPRLVYMNLSLLKTLPEREISCGMAEVLKYGYIKDSVFLDEIIKNAELVNNTDVDFLEKIVYKSADCKRQVVEEDPFEKGQRAILNFGHTIGHAIEKLMNFTLLHGECVALGMCAAAYISAKKGFIEDEEYLSVKSDVKLFNLPYSLKAKITAEDVLCTLKSDKKMENGKIKFVLLKRRGEAVICSDLTDDEIKDAINTVLIH